MKIYQKAELELKTNEELYEILVATARANAYPHTKTIADELSNQRNLIIEIKDNRLERTAK